MEGTRKFRRNSNTDSSSPRCFTRKTLTRDSPPSPTNEQQQRSRKVEKSKQPDSTHIIDDPNLSEDDSPPPEEIKESVIKHLPPVTNKSQSKAQEDVSRPNSLISYNFLVLLVVFGIALLPVYFSGHILGFWYSYSNAGKDKISAPVYTSNQAMELLDEMENSFPLQKKETWIGFLSALSSVIEEKPSQPAVVLLVGGNTPAITRTMQCVALALATNTNKLLRTTSSTDTKFPVVTVKVDEIIDVRQQEEAIKQELDVQIHSILNQSFSVVLGPLEMIPPRAALLLHGYCDNFMAPFKKSVIILTATFDSDKPLNPKQVERKLHNLWDPALGLDTSASIVSRVTNYVVFIQPESGSTQCTDIGSV
ncbi:uncharacterized protein LOC116925390 [Daphnia magna]|uniref:uncharacterized protein LOC116925390 n=1 Tax=Daphnia magna TaxID=35525 RepID=UPI0014036648|nr:uncharacterized protein LOC116925390 [Daphnia magna]XP_045027071.1 uncharacterized protein LOC116925390 [Daphnia magna]